MLNTTRVPSEEPTAEKDNLRSAGSSLTKGQKEATVQKWADWILKQRTAAKAANVAEVPRVKTASA